MGKLKATIVAVAALTCGGCAALAGLLPAAAGLAGDVASGIAEMTMSTAELAHKPDAPPDDLHKNESPAEREDRCDSLQLQPPEVVEIRKNASGVPEYRDLTLNGGFIDARWTPVTDSKSADDGGWRPAVNFLQMNFAPPLTDALPATGSGYLAYAAANSVSTADEDRLNALSADFGGAIGTFNWNGTVYRYAIARALPCFQPPA